jgi:hypothetical protein
MTTFTRPAFDFDQGQRVLRLLHVVLHCLRLFHQASQLVLHHDGILRVFKLKM